MHDQHLFLRNDTILGVCEAIGRDFGFHPNWLRIALGGGIFFAPVPVIASYAALAIPIALARWAFPPRSPLATPQEVQAVETPTMVAENEREEILPLAA